MKLARSIRRVAGCGLVAGLFWVTAAGCGGPARVQGAEAAHELEEVAGGRARVVWLQDLGDGGDVFAEGDNLMMMGLDTADGLGPRRLLPRPGHYFKPLITPDGDRVVFSSRKEGRSWVVDWDGGEPRDLGQGVAIEVWGDWAYVGDFIPGDERNAMENLRRIPLTGDGNAEPVWSRTWFSANNFQLSRDGATAAGLFPWPQAGTAELAAGEWSIAQRGCWTSMAPDDSRVFWVFDGQHRNLVFHHRETGLSWRVPVVDAPGIEGYETYHPRWSNHPRMMVMTGPYKVDAGVNRIRGGGPDVEIYVGRFSEDLGAIDRWVRVTDNQRGDFFPDLWVESGGDMSIGDVIETRQAAALALVNGEAVELGDAWPGTAEGLVFAWRDARSANEISRPDGGRRVCETAAAGAARYNRWFGMRTDGGSFAADADSARSLRAACMASGEFAVEAVLRPRSLDQAGPARIVSFSSDTRTRNLTLGQDGDELVMRVRTPSTGANGDQPQVSVARVNAGRFHHVIVSYRDGVLASFLDGKPVRADRRVTGGLEDWIPQDLLFGDEVGGGRPWAGDLDHVALYARFIGADEARQRYELVAPGIARREPAPRWTARARLVEYSEAPDPRDIEPYRRALATAEYEILSADGPGDLPDRLLVAHWVVLDARILPWTREVGGEYELALERWEDHPELDSERLVMETDAFDLPLYVDAGP